MRSLWIRIFATFWLIEILTLAGLVSLMGRIDNAFSSYPLSEKALLLMAFSAQESYQSGQCDQLNPLFARFQRAYKVSAYLFDETGRVVCSQAVPQVVLRAANEARPFGAMHGVGVIRSAIQNQNDEAVAAIRSSAGQNPPYTFVVRTSQVPSWFFLFRGQLGILAAIAVSGVITALLAKILVRPITRLRQTALQLASGNLKARAASAKRQMSKGDEVAALVHDFDRMADRIESLVGTQQRLIRDVSHELRSPLARLSVASELLREDANGQGMVHLDRIERETDRLNRLIGQLLELSRMEAMGGLGIRVETVQLADIVQEVVANAAYEASSRSCNVHAVIHDRITVHANSDLLSSAIENIVRNGIRYTNEGTDVVVTLERLAQQDTATARVIVRDFGPGVPDDKINSLCLPFYRVDTARSKETGGTGIGLAIADRALRLHGGSLALRNHPQGGLEVTVLLPSESSVPYETSLPASTSIV